MGSPLLSFERHASRSLERCWCSMCLYRVYYRIVATGSSCLFKNLNPQLFFTKAVVVAACEPRKLGKFSSGRGGDMERRAMLGARRMFNGGWFNRWGVTARRAWVADLRRLGCGVGGVWRGRRVAVLSARHLHGLCGWSDV